MSYVTYTTEALVCGAFDRNTADRTYLLYTKAAGMLYADAKSVREERSRQRYALQEFSLVRVSLVKGKHSWKVGSVEVLLNHYSIATDKAARGSVTFIYRTLRRYIRGEEASPALFDFCVDALAFVSCTISERTFVDAYIEVCLLEKLGYVDGGLIPTPLKKLNLSAVGALYSPNYQAILDSLITKATEHSQL